MLRKFARRININFRQASSDRAGILSYRNHNDKIRRMVEKVKFFTKIKK